MPIGDAVEKRDHEIEAGREHRMEPAEALDDPRALLRDDADRLDDADQDDDEDRKGDERISGRHAVLSLTRLTPLVHQCPTSRPLGAEHERRAARRHNVHRVAPRRLRACELAVPSRAAIDDARGAVRLPRFDAHALADVEPRELGWIASAAPPAIREHDPGDREHARDQQLHRHRGAEPGRDAAERERDPKGKQVERAGHELGPDQDRRHDPPQPVTTHPTSRRSLFPNAKDKARGSPKCAIIYPLLSEVSVDRRRRLRPFVEHADLRIPMQRVRARTRGSAETERGTAHRVPVLRPIGIAQAGFRGRIPIEGIRLVRHRLREKVLVGEIRREGRENRGQRSIGEDVRQRQVGIVDAGEHDHQERLSADRYLTSSSISIVVRR